MSSSPGAVTDAKVKRFRVVDEDNSPGMHCTPRMVIYFANTPMPHGSLSVRMAAIAGTVPVPYRLGAESKEPRETMSLSCRAEARYTFDALHAAGRPMTSCRPRSATSLYTILSQLACCCQSLSEFFEQMELTDPRMGPWNAEKAIQDPIKLDPQAGEARRGQQGM
jgi:hypothetical protein